MGRRRRSNTARWLKAHQRDAYVRQAHKEGYRSRAAYKLAEIQRRERILHPGMVVVDLGAAPGGWSQYAREQVGPQGTVIAVDVLDMEPVEGVTFVQGDFTEEATLERVNEHLGGRAVDLVLSDMSPNISGIESVDQPRAAALVELAMAFAEGALRPGGDLLAKAFQGGEFDALIGALRKGFDRVKPLKPKASRDRSREVYLLARGRKVM